MRLTACNVPADGLALKVLNEKAALLNAVKLRKIKIHWHQMSSLFRFINGHIFQIIIQIGGKKIFDFGFEFIKRRPWWWRHIRSIIIVINS